MTSAPATARPLVRQRRTLARKRPYTALTRGRPGPSAPRGRLCRAGQEGGCAAPHCRNTPGPHTHLSRWQVVHEDVDHAKGQIQLDELRHNMSRGGYRRAAPPARRRRTWRYMRFPTYASACATASWAPQCVTTTSKHAHRTQAYLQRRERERVLLVRGVPARGEDGAGVTTARSAARTHARTRQQPPRATSAAPPCLPQTRS